VPTAISVTAPLLLAIVLVLSSVGKLRSPDRARKAFTAMTVPAWLDRPWVATAHPWAEITLAVLLVVVPGPIRVAVAAAALLLMLVYLVLIIRAFRSPVDVDCACFGALGDERVTAVTIVRNAWLTALAAITLWVAVDERAVIARLAEISRSDLWWLVSVVAAAVTAALVLRVDRSADSQDADAEVEAWSDEERDYVRSRIPAVPVKLADGTTTDLRTLSSQRAQLLLFVSEGCGSCVPVIEAVPEWRKELPQLDVRFVLQVGPHVSGLTSTEEPQTLHDLKGYAKESFGTGATPSAILLGADGLLAGGPVVGSVGVRRFVSEIADQLRGQGH